MPGPWQNHRATMMTLGNARAFFFTAELSGCVVGFQKNADTPRVMHVGSNLKAQATDLLNANLGDNYFRYDSEEDEAATAMGYLSLHGWVFYVQRRAFAYRTITIRRGLGPKGVIRGPFQLEIPGQVLDIYTYKL